MRSFPVLLSLTSILSTAIAQGGAWLEYPGASGAAGSQYFGQSVAFVGDLDGDGCADWIAGAPGDSPGGVPLAGSAMVHSGRDGSLIRQHDGAVQYGSLGFYVAGVDDLDGDDVPDYAFVDLGEVGLGMPPWSGTLSVCSGASGALLWKAYGSTTGGDFGRAIAGGSDMNGDGVPDLLIGEPGAVHIGGQSNAGCVSILSGADGSTLSTLWGSDSFLLGYTVGYLEDTNGDGYDDIMVGVPGFNLYSNDGAVYTYWGGPTPTGPIVIANSTSSSAAFGLIAGPAGDVNGDGAGDFATADLDQQAVHTYSGANGLLLRSFSLPAGDALSYGTSLVRAGDTDQDGVPELAVQGISSTLVEPYLIVLSGAHGGQVGQIASPAGTSLYFGAFLSAGMDATGDGIPDLLAADPYADPGSGPDTGQVFVFGRDPFLQPSATALSVSGGAAIQYDLQFPPDAAGDLYQLLVSASGTGLITLPNHLEVRLTVDSWLAQTYLGMYPSAIGGATGVLNASAAGTITLTVPPGALNAGWVGTQFHLAVVCQPGANQYRYASLSVPLLVVP